MGSYDRAWLLQQMLPPMLIGAAALFLLTCFALWLLWRLLGGPRPTMNQGPRAGAVRTPAPLSGEQQEVNRRHLARIRELEKELEKELNERIASQRGAIREVNNLKKSLSSYTAHIDGLRAERDQLTARLREAEALAAAKEETLEREWSGARAQIAELKQALSDSESRNSRLGIELQLIRTIRTEFEALRKDNQQLEEALAAERQVHYQSKTRLAAEIALLEDESKHLREALEASRARLAHLEADPGRGDGKTQDSVEVAAPPNAGAGTSVRPPSQGHVKVSPKYKFSDPPAHPAGVEDPASFSQPPDSQDFSQDFFFPSARDPGGFAIPKDPAPPIASPRDGNPPENEVAKPDSRQAEKPAPAPFQEHDEAPHRPEVSEGTDRQTPEIAGADAILHRDPELGLLYRACPSPIDDLTKIKGVGRVLEGRLHELGVYRFKQIADWTDENVRAVAKRLSVKDRITRNRWREQCRRLHEEEHGEGTDGTDKADLS